LQECQRIIRSAWQKGLKSITIKREHCALYEEAMASDDVLEERRANQNWVFSEAQTMMSGSVSAVAAQLLSQFMKTRRELPLRRKGFTQKTTIGGQPVYLRTGEYEDGTLGELALDMPAASESTRALLQQFSRAISIALQYGVPMAAFVDAFARGTMKPLSPQTMNATSAVSMLLNHIFSELAASYMIDPLDVPSAAAPVRAFAGQRVA
jgi:ribonucleoside-diphosphate reductase alpha chain